MKAIESLVSRNTLVIHSGLLLFTAKTAATFLIFTTLLMLFNTPPLFGVWVLVSLIMDALLVFVRPQFLFDFTFTDKEKIRYRISTHEMKKHLLYSPMIRFSRTLLMSAVVIFFSSKANWDTNLLISLTIGFLVFDPIISKLFNIKTPAIFKKSPQGEPLVSEDIHRYNPAYIGSAAWNALESTRSLKNNP